MSTYPTAEEPTAAHQDAAALLEFGALIATLPDKSVEHGQQTYSVAQQLVVSMTKPRFVAAVTELRFMFLSLIMHQRLPAPPSQAIQLDRVHFLEWLVRLDLQRALTAEKEYGPQWIQNRTRWLQLDEAFDDPKNFWPAFSALRRADSSQGS